jgi:hypothetical protein
MPVDPEADASFKHILLIGFGEIAFCKAQVIDRIQQVGLANPIIAANSHDPFPELEISLFIVLELYE